MKIRDICFTALFASVIAVCSQISIPAGVPFTLQTFAVPLAGIVLGARKGFIAVAVYILIGAAGVPVFTQFKSGFAVLFGHTGGYIISFPFMAFLAGIGADLYAGAAHKNRFIRYIILGGSLVLGSAVTYAIGMTVGKFYMGFDNWGQAFAVFVAPFIYSEVIKIVLACGIGLNVKSILAKSRILV